MAESDRALSRIAIIIGVMLIVATRVARSIIISWNPITILLLGSLPNFGGGLALPFAVTILMSMTGFAVRECRQGFCLVCAGSFVVLVMWEWIQFWAWAFPIDWNDVVATGIGTTMAGLINVIQFQRQRRKKVNGQIDVV